MHPCTCAYAVLKNSPGNIRKQLLPYTWCVRILVYKHMYILTYACESTHIHVGTHTDAYMHTPGLLPEDAPPHGHVDDHRHGSCKAQITPCTNEYAHTHARMHTHTHAHCIFLSPCLSSSLTSSQTLTISHSHTFAHTHTHTHTHTHMKETSHARLTAEVDLVNTYV